MNPIKITVDLQIIEDMNAYTMPAMRTILKSLILSDYSKDLVIIYRSVIDDLSIEFEKRLMNNRDAKRKIRIKMKAHEACVFRNMLMRIPVDNYFVWRNNYRNHIIDQISRKM